MDTKINEYIEKQKSPQKEIIKEIRKIFHNTLPDCSEVMKWGVITFAEDKFYLGAMKDCVHVGFSINGLSKEEISLFEGSGKTMRHIKIHAIEDIDEKKLVTRIHLVEKKTFCEPSHKRKQ